MENPNVELTTIFTPEILEKPEAEFREFISTDFCDSLVEVLKTYDSAKTVGTRGADLQCTGGWSSEKGWYIECKGGASTR